MAKTIIKHFNDSFNFDFFKIPVIDNIPPNWINGANASAPIVKPIKFIISPLPNATAWK